MNKYVVDLDSDYDNCVTCYIYQNNKLIDKCGTYDMANKLEAALNEIEELKNTLAKES